MLQISRGEVLEEVSINSRSSAERQFDLGTFVVPSPDGDTEARCGEAFNIFYLKRVLKCKVKVQV